MIRCPAKAGTYKHEDGLHSIMFLYDMETHCCGQDQVGIIRQDFKNEVKRIMADDPRAKFGKVMVHLSFKVDLSSLSWGI